MTVPARPLQVPRWADVDQTDIVEPSSGRKDEGWNTADRPPAQHMNWLQNRLASWVGHYSEMQIHNWFLSSETLAENAATNAIASGGIEVQGFTPTIVRAWLGVGGPLGAKPLIYSSHNGERLTLDDTGAVKNFALNGCVYDPSLDVWVLVGDADGADAYILSGLPGPTSSWTERANPKNFELLAVANDGAGLFVAAGVHDGTDMYAVTSPDGTTWTERVIAAAAGQVNSIVWTGTNFVAVGQDGGGAPLIWTSPDGITWTSRTPGATSAGRLTSVAYNGRAVIAVGNEGEIHQSLDDGVTWTLVRNPGSSPEDENLRSVGADPGNGLLIVIQDVLDLMLYSIDDGLTWVRLPHTPRFNTPFAVGADAGGFIIAGSDLLAPTTQALSRSLRLQTG